MSTMLLILVREFAWRYHIPERDVYPILRLSDRKPLSFYVSGKGFYPFVPEATA